MRHSDGAGTVPLHFNEPETWVPVLGPSRGVFLMRPPAITDIDRTLAPFIDAVRRAGAGPIVFLSVTGADKARFLPHAAVERHLMDGPRDWVILRPGFFAQNLSDAYPQDIREDDRVYLPAGQGKAAFLDLRDLGEATARILADPEPHLGQAYTLTGPKAVDFHAVAQAVGEATGRLIAYRPASIAGYLRHLHRRGALCGQALVQTALHVGLRFGQAEAVAPDLARLLDRPPRDIFDYIRDHAELWATEPPRPAAESR